KQEARCSGSPAVSHRPAIDTHRRVLLAPAAVAAGSDCDPKTPETSSAAGPSASPPEPLTDASSPQQVSDWLERNRYSCRPGDITVCISDEMVSHMLNESKYTLHVLPDTVNAGRFRIVMKEYQTCCDE
uniref:SAM domain-containing protein n=1 Tax=Macrostomum lignano TaxID=282301 RepID=A0A1I8FS12_9PLAT